MNTSTVPANRPRVPSSLSVGLVSAVLLIVAFASDVHAQDGQWEVLDGVSRQSHTQVTDTRRDRILVFGGGSRDLRPERDVWTMDLDPPGGWARLETTGDPPAIRWDHVAVYDASEDRMVVYGGWPLDSRYVYDDLWTLELSETPARWVRHEPAGERPGPQIHGAAVYVPERETMLLVERTGDSFGGEMRLWELELGVDPVWRSITPTGDALPDATGMAMAYDTVRGEAYAFGGAGRLHDTPYSTLVAIDPATGTVREVSANPVAPAGRVEATLVHDPGADRLLLFGGSVEPSNTWSARLDELWQFDLATRTWERIDTSTPAPAPMAEHTASFDPANGRMVLVGGRTEDEPAVWFFDEVWTEHRSPSSPGPLSGAALGWDPTTGATVLVGGRAGSSSSSRPHEVWTRDDTGEWRVVDVGRIAGRYGSSLLHDPVRDRWLLHGGWVASTNVPPPPETWDLRLGPVPSLRRIVRPGPTPPSDAWQATTYDADRDRMIVVQSDGEVWALPLGDTSASWERVAPEPTLRKILVGRTVHYDPDGNRLLALLRRETRDESICRLEEMTLDDEPEWSEMSDPIVADDPVFSRASGIYDPSAHRFVLLDGEALRACDVATGVWTELDPGGIEVAPRTDHATAYDVARDAMIVYGGRRAPGHARHVELRWGTPIPPTPLALQAERRGHAIELSWRIPGTSPGVRAVVRVSANRFPRTPRDGIALGDVLDLSSSAESAGATVRVVRDDVTIDGRSTLFVSVFHMSDDGAVSAPGHARIDRSEEPEDDSRAPADAADPPSRILLRPAVPNPANPSTTLEFGLPNTMRTRIHVFDARGRRIATLDPGTTRAAGFHRVTWDGLDDAGRTAASGVYHCRLEAGSAVLGRRLTLVR